ncbi:MAG: ABC transporter ATP-binding protein, partial [Clostridia bacterium]|nr:ABC transporter ATP-binding protein [Clostridia bacterium]
MEDMEEMSTSALKEKEFDQKVDFKLWKRLIKYALRSKGTVILTIIANIVVAAIDIAYPLMSRYAIDNLIPLGRRDAILPFALIYAGLIIVQGAGVLAFILGSGRLEMKIAYAIRQDSFRKLQELSFSYYDKTAVGYIMARMVSDIGRLSELIAWSIIDLLWSASYIVGIIAIMLSINPILALLVIIVMPPL